MKKRYLILILLFISSFASCGSSTSPYPAKGTIYFVDATNGNDNNAGTSTGAPWKTVSKVNTSSFSPGDAILFKKGETWRETLTVPFSGNAGGRITFGAYGTGANPVITGADLITPGTNWSLTSYNVWHTNGITTEPKTVTMNGVFGKLKASTDAMLTEYDWYWAENVLYVYSATDPGTAYTAPGVEYGQRGSAINTNGKSYITIQDLTANTSNYYGIFLNGDCSNITVNHVGANFNRVAGILTSSSATLSNITMTNNTTSYNGAKGIYTASNNITQVVISGNTSTRDGSFFGPTGEDQWGSGIGMYGAGKTNVLITGNTISYAGYDRHENRVSPGNPAKGMGIWLDTVSGSNIVIRGNNVSNCAGHGIFVEKSDGVQVDYNLSFLNAYDGLRIDSDKDADAGVHISQNNKFYNNVSYGNTGNGLACVGGWAQDGNYVKNNTWKNNASVGNGVQFQMKWGGENDGSMGSGNVYLSNLLGVPVVSHFVEWGTGVHKDTVAAFDTAYGSATMTVGADPLFVSTSTSDFHLLPSSPAINAGINVSLTMDYEGNPVPVGSGPDIGAYENQSTSGNR